LQEYRRKNYRLLHQRLKTPFAEVDLVLRSPRGELTLVEVKSVTSFDFLHVRLTGRQKFRLRRALIWSLEKDPTARLELAVVSQQGDVLIFKDIFD
jgi:putative endonuclease